MSVIKKKPEIEVILERLDATQIASVKSVINSTTPETFKSFIDGNYPLNTLTAESPVEIASYMLQLDAQKTRNGVVIRKLIDNVLYEHFLVYGESQKITIYELNYAQRSYRLIEEYCDINELRRLLDEVGESSGDAWVEAMKEVMVYDDEEEQVEIGTHLYVDGKLEIGDTGGSAGDLVVGHEIIIDDLQKIVDTNGDAIVPDPTGKMNQALVHITTGYTWKKGYELDGFQLVSKATFEGGEFVTHTNIVYIVYDTNGTVYLKYYTA